LVQLPPLDPDVADTAPSGAALTAYDQEHVVTYPRLLDADAKGAEWREVARIVLHLDPEHEAVRRVKADAQIQPAPSRKTTSLDGPAARLPTEAAYGQTVAERT
jgi:hypothetical protein